MSYRILVVDDEDAQRFVLATFLNKNRFQVHEAASGEDALALLDNQSVDLVISDMKMGRISGKELLRAIRKGNPIVPFIMITAFGSVEDAVAVMKMGAADYITKPVNLSELLLKIERAIERKLVVQENEILRRELFHSPLAPKIITENEEMKKILSTAARLATTDVPVLIQGESGTGKELIARTVHELSNRKSGPFIPVNCASLNPGVLESELFGHERGAFTGAEHVRKGRFEMAENGTLFLDEVGDIPLDFQVKLLRVLQENQIERVGGNRGIPVNFRLVSATNKDLARGIRDLTFREDLFYRLNVVTLEIPPLRERKEDLLPLAEHFLRYYSTKFSIPIKGFSRTALEQLFSYSFPGNIRELINTIQRAIVLSRGDVIERLLLSTEGTAPSGDTPSSNSLPGAVEALERSLIGKALNEAGGVQTRAAEILGISERNLRYKLRKYSIARDTD